MFSNVLGSTDPLPERESACGVVITVDLGRGGEMSWLDTRFIHHTKAQPRIPKKKDSWRWSDEQERQCTYNVTMRRVRATIVAVERQLVLHIVSVCF